MDTDLTNWLASLQCILTGIQVWQNERSIKAASAAYKQEKELKKTYEWFLPELQSLHHFIPASTLEILIKRTDNCRSRYEEVLLADNEYLPAEIDTATLAVKKCICRELARIKTLSGGKLPTEYMQGLWEAYSCTELKC